jgi:hypothetical protein
MHRIPVLGGIASVGVLRLLWLIGAIGIGQTLRCSATSIEPGQTVIASARP